MRDILQLIRVASAARQNELGPADFKRAQAILQWQRETLAKARRSRLPVAPAMRAMMDYFSCARGNSIARMYGCQMLAQFDVLAKKICLEPAFASLDEWLLTMNYVIQRAPRYNANKDKQFFFPMSNLFVFYMFTLAGAALFRDKTLNVLLTNVLNSWCLFLDSPASQSVLNPNQATPATEGWLSPPAQDQFCLEQCLNYLHHDDPAQPYWGFSSYNAFFHREWNLPRYRPLAGENDDAVIVSANDGTVHRIAYKVDACTDFWTKGQNYSLVDMLDHSCFTEAFIKGDVMQSFLDGSDYHRWHAPISGKVVEARVIPGLTFSELLSEGLDVSAGTKSQGYQVMVNTRGLVIIDNPRLGKVAVLPTGITEISSVTINVHVGQELQKGEELGYFSYGGSTLALVFEKGMIESFTACEPPNSDADAGSNCKTAADCRAEQGCLMARSQIARAKLRH